MLVRDAVRKITGIYISSNARQVVRTCADELSGMTKAGIHVVRDTRIVKSKGAFCIGSGNDFALKDIQGKDRHAVCARLDESGSGYISASKPYLLYSFFTKFVESDENIDDYRKGVVRETAFRWNRSSYEYFISQEGRNARKISKETYIRELARNGFTHVEVNGLGFPMGIETGPKGEIYPLFYAYCAALDQFVYSELNKGIYPQHYLSINLRHVKENARLAVKYGLVPGFTSFEPRSVPEDFFNRYPMLRGARVDHPFRSFKPRYNMTTTHPKVLAHYREMVQKLMKEIPELGFISIWTSDSGAGFEHTCSLYVGRNGGAYLVREWNTDKSIAEQATANIMRFFRTLRDAASEINPDFRILTRLESFYGEHDFVWKALGDRIDVETNSLIPKGWDMPYHHPKYKDSREAVGMQMQLFYPEEKDRINELAGRGVDSHYYFSAATHSLFEPLAGIPYPGLTYKRLRQLSEGGVKNLNHFGGTCPREIAPYNVNHEIMSEFQYDIEMNYSKVVEALALKWAGKKYAETLLAVWNMMDEVVLAYPPVNGMYSSYGFTWYRFWLRPFVPDIEAIPEDERAYYEDHMNTTPHNPNNIDFSKDVLFTFTTQDKAEKAMERIDSNVMPLIKKAIDTLKAAEKSACTELGEGNVIHDLFIRLKALKLWFVTQRNIAAWIACVHGYLDAKDSARKKNYRKMLVDSIRMEIENSKELLELWRHSDVEFMVVSDKGETALIYGDNFGELLEKRISLMKKHINDEPYIDPDYVERKAGEPMK